MPRTILVTEGDSPLGGALVRLLAARGCTVAATSDRASSTTMGSLPVSGARSPLFLPWNRRSPVSARTVLLSVRNAFGTLDEALILEPPFTASGPLETAASADIERAFDESKGPVFIVREVLGIFAGRGAGVLGFVSAGGGGAGTGALESVVRESFRGLAASLMALPGNGAIVANGFQGAGAEPTEYAAFIDRTLEEKARKITGRWFSFASRGGFLQGVFKTSSSP